MVEAASGEEVKDFGFEEDGGSGKGWQKELVQRFGDRVTLGKIERLLYSHDVAALPGLVRMLYKGMPDAVAQPESKEDLVFLTDLSRRYGVPLVPRGSGTGGFGGCVPSRGGIVVEFNRMNKILDVNRAGMTVTVEPGVIIKDLDDYLRREHGLALPIVPTSAPGASLGGWVAAGGAGIGSNTGGYVGENVVAVDAIAPTGAPLFEVGHVVGLEGTTGFIASVTFRVVPAEDVRPLLIGFKTMEELITVLAALDEAGVAVWHVSFGSGRFRRLNEEAAALHSTDSSLLHQGLEPNDALSAPSPRTLLSAGWQGPALLLAPLQSEATAVEQFISARLAALGGEVLPAAQAQHAWDERYYPMRLKRLGPSLIPSESVIPLAGLKSALEELTATFGELAMEGTLIKGQDVAIQSFALGDERLPLHFALDFTKSLQVMDIAFKHGGFPYSLGMFFTALAPSKFGEGRYQELKNVKHALDPSDLFNPDKSLDSKNRTLAAAMSAARLGRPLAEATAAVLPKIRKGERPLPPGLAEDAFACVQCGYCRPVCSLYAGRGWESATPRGKFYFLREYAHDNIDFDQAEVDTFLMCTTCKRCNPECQVNIPIQEDFDQMRGFLVMEKEFATYPAFYLMKAATRAEHNIWAELQEHRADWVPDDIAYKDAGPLAYWAGCTASYIIPDIAQNAFRIFKEGGLEFAYMGTDENCCGAPMFMSGQWDAFEEVVRYNIDQFQRRGIKTLMVSCPGCWVFLNHYHREWAKKLGLEYDVEVRHVSEVIAELIDQGRLQFKRPLDRKVTWHDPCHIGRHGGIYDPPRKVLQSLPGLKLVEMVHNREHGLCCGSVLTRIKEPVPTSDRIAALRLDEAAAAGADLIYTTCPCCEFQFRVAGESIGHPMRTFDFTNAVVEALGYEGQDTTQTSLDIWVVFDKMIRQMAVEGIAQMMRDLMPEMLANMPEFMNKSMGMMKPLPEGMRETMLGAMRPLIPKLMPAMMPGIMPKVLPDIVRYMEEQIPGMPPAMRQLLPQLLPVVMNDMMPKMLPHVLPLVVDDIIKGMADSLKGANKE
jgi:Fe-S oxidoreductase/FAD/FMN-containing dehydrogenase